MWCRCCPFGTRTGGGWMRGVSGWRCAVLPSRAGGEDAVKFFGPRRGAGVFEAVVEHVDDNVLGQQLTLRWWNMPFMSRVYRRGHGAGRLREDQGAQGAAVHGPPGVRDHPGGEDDERRTIHTGRITPVYRLRGGLTQKALRTAGVACACRCSMTASSMTSFRCRRTKASSPGWNRVTGAARRCTFPPTAEELDASRPLSGAGGVLWLSTARGATAASVHAKRAGSAHTGDEHLLARFPREPCRLQLTGAQKRSLGEIRRDMASDAPMNRLLHGDVGSGKTVVALAAMLIAVESGSQAALMAPTQILAEQHYLNARAWLEPSASGWRCARCRKEDGSGIECLSAARRVNPGSRTSSSARTRCCTTTTRIAQSRPRRHR